MHDHDTKRGLGALHPGDVYERKLAAERGESNMAQAAASISCERSPYEVREAVNSLAFKYAQGTPERELLTEAAQLMWRQETRGNLEAARAERAERHCQSFNDKIRLAQLALRSPTVD